MNAEPKFLQKSEIDLRIPVITEVLNRLNAKRDLYLKQHDELFLEEILSQVEGAAGKDVDADAIDVTAQGVEQSVIDIEKELIELRKLGAIVRNIEKGYLDFPGKWNEKPVYFSWKKGESEILYYHEKESAYTDRKPLAA